MKRRSMSINIDKNNPVVKLCIDGQRAESQGNMDSAHMCYLQAWKVRKNDMDACIAAHFVARTQSDMSQSLKWNLISLKYVNKIEIKKVKEFYPSLYINIANAYERLGKIKEAKKYYDLAASTISETSLGSYGIILAKSIIEGQRRTNT